MPPRRSPIRLIALLAAIAGCTAPCTPDLTPAEVLPYQSCAAETDCTVDDLSCNNCVTVAIAVNQVRAFEAMRGCWPQSGQSGCAVPLLGGGCGSPATCVQGRCVLGSAPGRCAAVATAVAGTNGGSFTAVTAMGSTSAGAATLGSSTSAGFGSASGSSGASSGTTGGQGGPDAG